MMSFIASNWDWLAAIVGSHVNAWWVLPWIGRAAKAAWGAVTATPIK